MTSLENKDKLPGEPQEKIFSPEIFIAKLFDELSKVLTKNPQQKVFEIPQQKITAWDHHDEDVEPGTNPLPNNIIGGFILRSNGYDLAVVLGERQTSKWSAPTLSLQFGIELNGGIDENIEDPLKKAKNILSRKAPRTAGDFFIDPEKGVVLDFYPSQEDPKVKAIRELSQEQLLTRMGLESCIRMVQSLGKNGVREDSDF